MTKKIYSFTMVLDTFTNTTGGLEDKLYKAGCDDALLYFMNNTVHLDFDREAESLEQAIETAIENISNVLTDYQIIALFIDVKRYLNINEWRKSSRERDEYIRQKNKSKTCSYCDILKFSYYIHIEPLISNIFLESSRRTNDELICKKCRGQKELDEIKAKIDLEIPLEGD